MGKRKGTTGDDVLTGGGGDDRILGLAGNDTLSGGVGDDRLLPGTGSDHLYGGFGDDIAIITELDYTSPDTFDGGSGFDRLDLSAIRNDTGFFIYWGYDSTTGYTVNQPNQPGGVPHALTFTGVEQLVATDDDDLISLAGSPDSMTIDAGGGNDWVRAGFGHQIVHAGAGNDLIDFGWDRIAFFGDEGDDEITVSVAQSGSANGGTGFDTITGSGDVNLGRGWATGSSGRHIAISGFESVSMVGAADGATATGDARDNLLTGDGWPASYNFVGAGGDDTIIGADGGDGMSGGTGDDVLDGGAGDDTMTGGTGADRFRVSDDFFASPTGTDIVTDFNRPQGDRIDLSGIDADPDTFLDHEPLRYLGTAAFDGRGGEVRWEVRGADTFVQVDVDGDNAAEFELRIEGVTGLRRGDFMLFESADASGIHNAAPVHPAAASPELMVG